ncbi:bifunctional hydroxymethylpyrimidine kinase/phosphomethylpyrimidine kinase [Luteolibacter yonseiensis]|uniref:hydroxymethylpyrimidine kinase n=1 Tax=Luteolibacter yonseiensis TaxID=1144680 RepID=A0A934R6G8_9BACT|nr:bifunctional hydroxymethylpyrimidine kinase/phosphomethylpyrimidine kinase [Luteolibacter yonseiensis]MBK1817262.1 bifunctional hydroxymethylpyrimidine kinase/phosphomethylpyrimidine kinase [Luteolibacter yonseiensis]
MTNALPVALTIAGSDCSAGAGIQADLKTFQHFHVHGLTAVTCVVSETANIVRAVHAVPVEIVRDQISLMLESFPIAAVKTGMLFSAAHVTATAEILRSHPEVELVVDPVMIASTGAPLLEPDAMEAYRELLLPLARIITPNLPEAEALLGEEIPDAAALESAARRLSDRFGTAILLKGGHLDGPVCTDLLVEGGVVHRFEAERIPVPGSHGTGCTLSAAIAAGIALGRPLPEAVEMAKRYLGKTLEHSYAFHSATGEAVHALNQGTAAWPIPTGNA